jgi:hypothetical protein
MMLQLLRLFSGMILQTTISFVVLHCVPFAWRMKTLINININLNVGRTEVKEKTVCVMFQIAVFTIQNVINRCANVNRTAVTVTTQRKN